MGLIGVRDPTGCLSVEKDEYGGSEGANLTTATWQMIMIRKNKAGLTIRPSSVQTQTQIQTQQITTPDDIGTVRTELTTQTSHNFWCCAPYHARAVTPDEHDLEQRIRPYLRCTAQHTSPRLEGKEHKTRGKGPMKEEAYQSAKSNLVTSVATYTVTATYNYSSSTVEQLR
ncbi:unnamed protein product [Fusarium graminearum]|uniref:Uncharacterized protein n=1 Tax=Gibberella zeae TaxID=5518 RepID=A0A4U9F577_GIBZA|nr:unnamed protein product [Fusarium graminearum]CAF3588052.1 unnamed protein product [Fusarium graminearum]CAF3600938.1 unnamed protein product [Fusarium graminearum]CAG1970142.1 unnamed protein product [Fusarium graminearum]CAG1979020.1 unnamed protein product [Fusarium graminearum]